MAVAGIAWGAYSLLGRSSGDAIANTARNFALIVPPVLLVSAIAYRQIAVSLPGLELAIASGAITSGLGYVIWYAALPRLTATQAASAQLTVPVFAAAFGVMLLAEPVTGRLATASLAILGGVAVVVSGRGARAARPGNR